MVEIFLKLLKIIEKEKGLINLLMLVREETLMNKWNVIISANWVNLVGKTKAVEYATDKLRSVLSYTELNTISRISVLNTFEPFVVNVTSQVIVIDTPLLLKEFLIGNIRADEVIIIKSVRVYVPISPPITQNPKYNSTINPIYNSTINPTYNSTINPIYNSTINPTYNSTINPIYNATINPVYNATLNPIYNATINPIYNATLNPIYNSSLNPNNAGFKGRWLYSKDGNKISYLISANDSVMLLFDFNSRNMGTVLSNNQGGYNFFDTHSKWIGYLVPNGKTGYNYFSLNASWLGYLI